MLVIKTPKLHYIFYSCAAVLPSLSIWQDLLFQRYLSLRLFSTLTLMLSVASHHAQLISVWFQAHSSLSRGGLGLRSSLSKHSCAAFIASFCSTGLAASDNSYLTGAVASFNRLFPTNDANKGTSLIASPPRQRCLSIKLDLLDFQLLLDQSLLG